MSKTVKIGKHDVEVIGKFLFSVNRDPKIFRITNINAFVPPGKSLSDRIMFKTKAGLVESLMIDKIHFTLRPDDGNEIDLHNVCALIQHDDVRIYGMSEEEHMALVKLGLKKPNPKFTIKNIDKFEDQKFEKEVKLIQIRGMLFDAKNPIPKVQLIWLCSKLGVPYKTSITEETRYINHLKKTLDSFIQSSDDNALAFKKAVEDIKHTELIYYINEFKENGIITDIGGIYKIGERPVGAGNKSIIDFFDQNPEIFKAHKATIIQKYQNTVLA
jgi:hypothetical protein